MSDYINREDTIKAIESETYRHDYLDHVIDIIEDIPSADVAPVRHGHFVKVDNMWSECSECGNQVRTIKKYNVPNYCPACGARMDGESDE